MDEETQKRFKCYHEALDKYFDHELAEKIKCIEKKKELNPNFEFDVDSFKSMQLIRKNNLISVIDIKLIIDSYKKNLKQLENDFTKNWQYWSSLSDKEYLNYIDFYENKKKIFEDKIKRLDNLNIFSQPITEYFSLHIKPLIKLYVENEGIYI